MKQHSQADRAFTLIELLAVIGIIGVLVALLFPAIKSALIKSEVVRAQSGISNLSTAFKAYYTEYGKWPVTDTTSNQTYDIDQNFVALLQGVNNTSSLTGSGGWIGPFTPTPLGTSHLNGNPRGIHFLDFKASDLDVAGTYIDPWKTPYYVCFDVSYANSVQDPLSSPFTNLSAGFLIWSSGPDGQYNNLGDALPGQALSQLNQDNVKSW
jgi:prepilin-type N-terminal cleavage/methylation domain-containing protein